MAAHHLTAEWPSYLDTVVTVLREQGIQCAPGLTDAEIADAEHENGFHFPPDLRSVLEHAMPVGDRFPDWRYPGSDFIRGRLDFPADGICFDVEHNEFWLPAWGTQPERLEEAFAIAREAVRAAPLLIPVYSHRYLPASPCEAGNPVLSVHQTDIIPYGIDLPSYLFAEFGVPNPFPVPASPREIAMWTEIMDFW